MKQLIPVIVLCTSFFVSANDTERDSGDDASINSGELITETKRHWRAQTNEGARKLEETDSAPSEIKDSSSAKAPGSLNPKSSTSLKSSLKEDNENDIAKSFPREIVKRANEAHLLWIYDAGVTLFRDTDNDGYYQSLDLSFDVDTNLGHAYVFAVVYLGDQYTYKEIHTTSVFSIYGDSAGDEFIISSELLQGFPPNDYDILIEVYDAETGELHDFYDHTQDPDLSLVSLESSEYEYQQTTPIYSSVVATTERGGSMGILLPISVLAFAMFRRGY